MDAKNSKSRDKEACYTCQKAFEPHHNCPEAGDNLVVSKCVRYLRMRDVEVCKFCTDVNTAKCDGCEAVIKVNLRDNSMNGQDQLLTIVDVLQNTFDSITRDPKVRGSGRTHKMLEDVAEYILSEDVRKDPQHIRGFRVFVMMARMAQRDYFMQILFNILETKKCVVTPEYGQMTIDDNIHVDFITADMLGSYAGYHPTPKKFIDHDTEEEIIDNGLIAIKNKLKLLRSGE